MKHPRFKFAVASAIAAALCLGQGTSDAFPPPDGRTVQLAEEIVLSGEALDSVILAWTTLQASVENLPPLANITITYRRSEAVATGVAGVNVRFSWPLPERIENGLRAIPIRENFYVVIVRDGQARIADSSNPH